MQLFPFGNLPDGPTVEAYSLANANGFSLQVITYGATVTSLRARDRDGRLADVLLGFDNLADYLAPHPYFGAMAGRVAGRISGACFVLDASCDPVSPSATPPSTRFPPSKIP